ncbi:putative AC transposase [Bienertia sinuspersici]
MTEPEQYPDTLEVSLDWDQKVKRAVALDKLNYMGMLLTCPAQCVIADELPFSFGESPNYEYFNRVALQPQHRRVLRNTLKRHTQQCEEYEIKKKVISLNTPTRWNSTYKLLHDAITYRDVLSDMYNESRSDGRFITNDHWSLAKIVHDPNIHILISECIKIICTIKQTSMANPDPSVKDLLDNMKVSNSKVRKTY